MYDIYLLIRLFIVRKVSEVTEYWNPSDRDDRTAWRLTPAEVRSTLALR